MQHTKLIERKRLNGNGDSLNFTEISKFMEFSNNFFFKKITTAFGPATYCVRARNANTVPARHG